MARTRGGRDSRRRGCYRSGISMKSGVCEMGWLGSFGQISGWDKWTTLLS